jgi:hypothetical protein
MDDNSQTANDNDNPDRSVIVVTATLTEIDIPRAKIVSDLPNQQAIDLLRWVRDEIVELCAATADDEILRHVADTDLEGKQGSYSRGRIREAESIGFAMCEVINAKVRELANGQ